MYLTLWEFIIDNFGVYITLESILEDSLRDIQGYWFFLFDASGKIKRNGKQGNRKSSEKQTKNWEILKKKSFESNVRKFWKNFRPWFFIYWYKFLNYLLTLLYSLYIVFVMQATIQTF